MTNIFKDFDQYLVEGATTNSDRLALTDGITSLSWAGMDAYVNQIAQALIAKSIGPDRKVAALSANSIEYMLVFFGSLRAGATFVPLSTLASPAATLAMVEDSGAKILFLSDDYAAQFGRHFDSWENRPDYHIVRLNPASLTAFMAEYPAVHPKVNIEPDHGFNLIYSSGTTGVPKGIMHDRRYRSREIADMCGGFLMDQRSRTIISTPLYSNTTLFCLLSVMAAGGAAYIMPKFDADRFLKITGKFRPTHQILVPVQYDRILSSQQFDTTDLSSFHVKFCTSAPLAAAKKREILDRWPAGGLVEFYGMTEGGVSFILLAHEHPNRLASVGQPTAGSDVVILDDQGQILPTGAKGEIAGWSPKMMRGYHNRADATEETIWVAPDGRRFQKSGDIGWMDDEGFLFLLDRKKDVIISGGFNIYASDLEDIIMQSQSVREAAVVGVPDERWGETPVAFVEPRGQQLDVPSLLTSVNMQLGKGQRLSAIHVIEQLPRSPIGKILKRELREIAVQFADKN